MTKKIDDLLGLNVNLPATVETNNTELVATNNETMIEDVEHALENIYEAIESSKKTVEDMLSIAQQSQHPKAYEVLNSCIKTLADTSKDLVDIHLKRQKLESKSNNSPGEDNTQTVNHNTVIVSSTADLQKMINDLKNKNNDE